MSLSRSAKYYRKNKRAREAKAEYDTKYHATPERKKYRSALNKARKARKLKGDDRDLSHTKNGGLVLESKKTNRGRQGSNGGSTKK
jgi:hypothetical protein